MYCSYSSVEKDQVYGCMKIITVVRTRNEESRIERFIRSYQWADKILVADGGSEDNTVSLCKSLPKTEVRYFDKKVKIGDEGQNWRNPHGEHINFMIDWATEEGADWIIFDDCDCIPNYLVKEDARHFLKRTEEDCVMLTRIYFYKEDRYFEKLTKPTGDWTPSLWAWKTKKSLRAKELNPLEHTIDISGLSKREIMPPYCLLHYFYPSDEFMQKKLDFYRIYRPTILDPKEYGGELLEKEWWMKE